MSSNAPKQSQQLSVALLRLCCCLAVIILHASVPVVFAHGAAGWVNWWAGILLNSASRVAVPIFILISGGLTLYRTDELAHHYWLKRAKRLGLPLLFWIPWYLIFFHFVRGDALNWQSITERLIFSEQFEHLYFLILLLQLAFITPWLRSVLQRSTQRQQLQLCFAATVVTLIWQPKQFMPLLWIPYVSYYLWGGYISTHVPRYPHRSVYLPLYAISVLIMVAGTRYLTVQGVTDNLYFLRYSSPTVLVASLALFAFARQHEETLRARLSARYQRTLTDLSRDALAVYLVAQTTLALLQQWHPYTAVIPMLAIACATALLSWLAVRLFQGAVYLTHHARSTIH